MISIIFFIIALALFILALIMSLFSDEEDTGSVALIILALSIVMFFVSAASFIFAGEDYYAYAYLSIGIGFIALVIGFIGAFNLFGED